MSNAKLRAYFATKQVKQWEVAQAMGISESSFCKLLRAEQPEDLIRMFMTIADQIAAGRVVNNDAQMQT